LLVLVLVLLVLVVLLLLVLLVLLLLLLVLVQLLIQVLWTCDDCANYVYMWGMCCLCATIETNYLD
jgi:hypothetical protein